MLRLAALPLAINYVEVHFDRMADRRVLVGGHLHKQHTLQEQVFLFELNYKIMAIDSVSVF